MDKPALKIFADSANFDTQTLEVARMQLQPYFEVEVDVLLQRMAHPPANVLILWALSTLQSLPAALLDSTLYEVLRTRFVKPKADPSSHITFRISQGNEYIEAICVSNDTALLRDALATFREVAREQNFGKEFIMNPETHVWEEQVFDDGDK